MPDLKKMLTLEALSEALPSWLKRSTKPEYNADEIDSTLTTNQFVTASDKDNWNAKGTYSKPSGGIPKSDLSSIVQASLEKADSALQSETDPTVPSWAKQTNKPTYNSDEISDTNRTHKFATAAQLTQISTNQTNILYAVRNGVKNQLKLTGDVWNPNTLYVYWDYENGTVRITGSTATTDTVFLKLGTWTAPEDGVYRIFANSAACTANIRVYDNANWNTYTEGGYSNEATWTKGTTRTIYVRIAKSVVVGDVTITPMICQKSVFDADSTFVPYAAPNSDLTYLEAEDRAALAEEIDAGAKNIANIPSTQTISSITFTKDSNEWITSTSTNDTRAWNASNRNVSYSVKAGTYIVYAEAPSTNTGDAKAYVFRNDTPEIALDVSPGQSKYIEITFTSASNIGIEYKTNQNKVRYMICTKAAFGVSKAFVPYCKPLTSKMDHTYSLGSSIDLNTILRDGSYMCNPSANSPVSGLCFLKVTNDGSTDLQQTLQKLNNPETIYIRHRRYQSSSPYYSWTSWFAFTGTVVS